MSTSGENFFKSGGGGGVTKKEIEEAAGEAFIKGSEKGAASGVAPLSSSLLPEKYLPPSVVIGSQFPGFTPAPNEAGAPVLTVISNWGIEPNGSPYYNAAGAAPGEAAALSIDPASGSPILTLIGGQQ